MKRYFLITLLFGFIIVSTVVTYNYFKLLSSENIIINNLEVLSTGSGYICINITNNKIKKTVICPNNVLFDHLRGYNRFYIHPFYFYKIGSAIDKDGSVNVSAKIFKELDHYTVDLAKVQEIEKVDLFKDTSYLKDGYINYRLNWSTQKAVAYYLLKRGVNCHYGCESGLIIWEKSKGSNRLH